MRRGLRSYVLCYTHCTTEVTSEAFVCAAADTCGATACAWWSDRGMSFSVWQSDGSWFWKCHAGCGEGDEITFLELLKRISRREAIKLFLETAGVEQTISQLPPQKATSETSKLELARVR